MVLAVIVGSLVIGLVAAMAVGLIPRHGISEPDVRAEIQDGLRGRTGLARPTPRPSTRRKWHLVAVLVVGNLLLVLARGPVARSIGLVLLVGAIVALFVVHRRDRRHVASR
jgi:hypothetical protein